MTSLKLLFDDDTLLVEKEGPRIWQVKVSVRPVFETPGKSLSNDRAVYHPQPLDFNASFVCQEWVGDFEFFGELRECLDRVVTDGQYGNVVSLGHRLLQLDQLRPAPRSPVSASVEHDQCTASCPIPMQINLRSGLIAEDHIGEPFAHCRADPIEVNVGKRGFGWY